MASQDRKRNKIINREDELITRNEDIDSTLFGLYRETISVGTQGRLFRNGAFERDLPPGSHTWYDPNPFNKYSIATVNSQVQLYELVAPGAIPGPLDENGRPTPACDIKLPLRIRAQLADIEVYLNNAQPKATLVAMIQDHLTYLIGNLRYEQFTNWAQLLRDGWMQQDAYGRASQFEGLEHYLQVNATPRTGMGVLEVLIDQPQGRSEADRRQLELYRNKTAVQRRIDTAEGTRTEADTLGISSALLGINREQGGKVIIEANTRLREAEIAAGLHSGNSVNIVPDQRALPPQQAGMAGYLSAPSRPLSSQDTLPSRVSQPWPGTLPGEFRTDPGGPTSPMASVPPAQAAQSIDPARVEAECRMLPEQTYNVNSTPGLVDDGSGNSVRGYQIIVNSKDATRPLRVDFDLPPGFPHEAPVVWVKYPGETRSTRYLGPAVRNWAATMWLNDVLSEIVNSPRL